MSIQTWMLFAAAYLATTLSPGPNVLLVIRNTVRYGAHGTAATIAGNLVAQGVVVLLVALGVGAVLAAIPPLFVAMKVIGAAYLMVLGSGSCAATARPASHRAARRNSPCPIAGSCSAKRCSCRAAIRRR